MAKCQWKDCKFFNIADSEKETACDCCCENPENPEKHRSLSSYLPVGNEDNTGNLLYKMIFSTGENDGVDHPTHYGGEDNPFEPIKIIEHYNLDFHLGNVIKYVLRAGLKDGESADKDLKKALWYLQRKVNKNDKD